MSPQETDEAVRAELLQRLKAASAPSYLTLTSVVQSVVLADLAGVVSANHTTYSLVQWSLILPTFLLIIAGWNQITIDTIPWASLPNLVGSLIAFILGGAELFLNHTLSNYPQVWLIGLASILTLSTISISFVDRRVVTYVENRSLHAYLGDYRKAGQRYNMMGSLILLTLAIADILGGFAALNHLTNVPGLAIILSGTVATLYLIGLLKRHLHYWHVVTNYAQSLTTHHKILE